MHPINSSRTRLGFGLSLALLLAACTGGTPTPGPGPGPVDPDFPAAGVSVNFQPEGLTPPEGFLADTGKAFDAARGYGWVQEDSLSGARVPLDLSRNTRERKSLEVDKLSDTLIHMQFPAGSTSGGTSTPGAWEYKLPNGTYTVQVSVGDASNSLDSTHLINIEGQSAFEPFAPLANRKFFVASRQVTVSDGYLTLDAKTGTNTKLNYVRILSGARPSVRYSTPQPYQQSVDPSVGVSADLNLLDSALSDASLTSDAVRLVETATGAAVLAEVSTSGGRDVIVLTPKMPLKPSTQYTFSVTSGVKDTNGRSFLPWSTTFLTGPTRGDNGPIAFERVVQTASVSDQGYTSVEIGPDNRLYAATIFGEIRRFDMAPDGTLQNMQIIKSVQNANNGQFRSIIGMKFAPGSTRDNLTLYVTNNYFWTPPRSGEALVPAPEWSGKITRLRGPNLEQVQDIVVGLPRSAQDHMTNSIELRAAEPNVLYVLQGSNTALGAPDSAWAFREERLLTAALLRVDLSKITSFPLDVQTEDGKAYDPFAAGAPLTIYASGIRNAYDMVWHRNGKLYVPTNGTASGGVTPGTPSTLPAVCAKRPDGGYANGPRINGFSGADVQRDYLFRVEQGRYYGHPNPKRCEYVAFGGNPTASQDAQELRQYPVGTLPDPNWRSPEYDFGVHASPNGAIEEYRQAGGSPLNGKLLVARFSTQRDILVLTPDSNGNIISVQSGITGLTNINPAPLDLTQNRGTGFIYLAQLDQQNYGRGQITLLRPQ